MDKETHKKYISHHEEHLKDKGIGTKLIHCGQEPDIVNGTVVVPISLSTTYAQHSPGTPYGVFDYSRCGNPTREHLERLLCAISKGEHCITFSSGCAATNCIAQLIPSGNEIICIDDVYGGTQRLLRRVVNPNSNIKMTFTPMDDLNVVKGLLNEKTKLVWLESPTNPTLKMTDIPELVKVVKEYNKDILIVVDNTFLSPYNCTPLDFGIDIVVESCTKYLGGHSDVTMGSLVTNNLDLKDKLYLIAKSSGGCPSPFDCFLLIRGLKTLHLRMERINSNSIKVAEFLSSHPKVEKVYYPGLEKDPYHNLMKKLCHSGGVGGIVSAKLKTDMEGTIKFIKSLKIFCLAESLGAVECLIDHPATMTHGSVPPEERKKLGIEDSFVRFAVGCEDIKDIIFDLEFAMKEL